MIALITTNYVGHGHRHKHIPSSSLFWLGTTPGYFMTPYTQMGERRNDLPYKHAARRTVFHVAAENERRSDVVKFHLMLGIIIVWHQLIWRWYR